MSLTKCSDIKTIKYEKDICEFLAKNIQGKIGNIILAI